MRRQIDSCARLLERQQIRYLVAGAFNTSVNYVVGAAMYKMLLPRLNFWVVGLVVTIVSISISFTTQKVFVFRTTRKWWIEYLRSYLVYGSAAVLSVCLMWLLLNRAHINIWLAQAVVTAIAVTISYVGHTAFTFKQAKPPGAKSAAR